MKKNKKISRREKGSLTIELVLIFPVLMLLFFLFFQVSVMLLTYHSLQTTVSHAALAATTASSMDEITAVVNAGTANWYYKTNE
ncbi:MAG: TadE/TadG family type IV pilus assembly protein, partial [Thermoguttaceae bacterium]